MFLNAEFVLFDPSLAKIVSKFVSRMKDVAVSCQKYGESVRKTKTSGSMIFDPMKGKDTKYTRSTEGEDKKNINLPLCIWNPHQEKGVTHLIKDCTQWQPEEKETFLDVLLEKLYRINGARRTSDQFLPNTPSTVMITPSFASCIRETILCGHWFRHQFN